MRLLSKVTGLALAGTVAFVRPAALADGMPRRSLKDVPPPSFSWSGFYVGAHVGYGWAPSDLSWSQLQTPLPGVVLDPIRARVSDDALVGGVHGGYNWQINR